MFVVNGKGSMIRFVAGLFLLSSVLLAVFVSEYWLIFTAFIGMNLLVSSLTGFCMMEKILIGVGLEERKIVKK